MLNDLSSRNSLEKWLVVASVMEAANAFLETNFRDSRLPPSLGADARNISRERLFWIRIGGPVDALVVPRAGAASSSVPPRDQVSGCRGCFVSRSADVLVLDGRSRLFSHS